MSLPLLCVYVCVCEVFASLKEKKSLLALQGVHMCKVETGVICVDKHMNWLLGAYPCHELHILEEKDKHCKCFITWNMGGNFVKEFN